jgi:hypothetical protein
MRDWCGSLSKAGHHLESYLLWVGVGSQVARYLRAATLAPSGPPGGRI